MWWLIPFLGGMFFFQLLRLSCSVLNLSRIYMQLIRILKTFSENVPRRLLENIIKCLEFYYLITACVCPQCSLMDFFVREAHGGGLRDISESKRHTRWFMSNSTGRADEGHGTDLCLMCGLQESQIKGIKPRFVLSSTHSISSSGRHIYGFCSWIA